MKIINEFTHVTSENEQISDHFSTLIHINLINLPIYNILIIMEVEIIGECESANVLEAWSIEQQTNGFSIHSTFTSSSNIQISRFCITID